MPLTPGDEDRLSRTLAEFVTGDGSRRFSAICWERRWTGWHWFVLRLVVDRHFRRLRGEVGHCRRASQEDREAAAIEAAEVDQRARLAGW